MAYTINCAHCRADFTTAYKAAKFCSRRCKGLRQSEENTGRERKALPRDEMVQMYVDGMSCMAIARKIGCSHNTVLRLIGRRGVEKRPLGFDSGKARTGVRGPAHHNWRGGRHVDRKGYVWIAMPNHPRCNAKGLILEHRWVWEQAHGPIDSTTVIHHINHVTGDNRLENLMALTNAEHLRLHAAERRKS